MSESEYAAALKRYYLEESNREELFALIRSFAQEGRAKAILVLSLMYRDGDGTDVEKGRSLLRLAAEAGNPDAQFELSSYFSTGQFGFETDDELAGQMLMKAVNQGHLEAMYNHAVQLLADDAQRDAAVQLLRRAAPHHLKAKELLASIQH